MTDWDIYFAHLANKHRLKVTYTLKVFRRYRMCTYSYRTI
jgi:hypothetical protein